MIKALIEDRSSWKVNLSVPSDIQRVSPYFAGAFGNPGLEPKLHLVLSFEHEDSCPDLTESKRAYPWIILNVSKQSTS